MFIFNLEGQSVICCVYFSVQRYCIRYLAVECNEKSKTLSCSDWWQFVAFDYIKGTVSDSCLYFFLPCVRRRYKRKHKQLLLAIF